jgi:DNA-binding NarL/FixJ family response regulator
MTKFLVPGPIEPLTRREVDTAHCLLQGLPNRAIAATLGVAEGTVKHHMRSLVRKLRCISRTDAALFLARNPEVLAKAATGDEVSA